MIYYENLIDLLILVISADTEYSIEYNMENPFSEAKKLNSYLLKIVTDNTIEEKINLCFFLAQPTNFACYFNKYYINMRTLVCSIKPFKNTLNTFCKNIGSYIGYYNYSNTNISIIYNLNINKMAYYYPIYYNPFIIKNIYIVKRDDNILIRQYHGNEWNRFIMIINNTFSNLAYERFPFNNPEFTIIQDYIKQIKYNEEDKQ
jgi:hypothetical protein